MKSSLMLLVITAALASCGPIEFTTNYVDVEVVTKPSRNARQTESRNFLICPIEWKTMAYIDAMIDRGAIYVPNECYFGTIPERATKRTKHRGNQIWYYQVNGDVRFAVVI